jgi:predicted esterase
MLVTGAPIDEAKAAMILLHGRGASARDILTLVPELDPGGMAYLAPEAAGNSWWPHRFIDPLEDNEPYFSSALAQVSLAISRITQAGIPQDATVLLGFSQGACLALEFAARNPRRYGGVVGLSGGLFGPPGTPRDYPGSLEGTPVFIGCSDVDPHIPKERVEESAAVFERMGADVTMRLYPGMRHIINDDEMAFAHRIIGLAMDSKKEAGG